MLLFSITKSYISKYKNYFLRKYTRNIFSFSIISYIQIQTSTYSYRAFWDVIVPNQLLPYSPSKFEQIEQFIRLQISQNHQRILFMTLNTAAVFRKDLEQQVKEVFELDSTNVEYSYKKLSDKIRNHIQGRLNVPGIEKHEYTLKSTTQTDDEIMDLSVLFNVF
ncbi:Hypothetical_protein [Hexamita inflata]|uniref:Hypothetical_protein n=1 Tax=Hexamita inflata TaxID=28002 RepID=A0AA86P054_9EUKA|nr:Hypothetical protein HINF_LOCUS16999 [Hexamita inflata]